MAYLIDDPARKQAPTSQKQPNWNYSILQLDRDIFLGSRDLICSMPCIRRTITIPAEEAVKSILDKNLFDWISIPKLPNWHDSRLTEGAKYYPEVLIKGWMPQIYAMPDSVFFNPAEILDFLGKMAWTTKKELTDSLKKTHAGAQKPWAAPWWIELAEAKVAGIYGFKRLRNYKIRPSKNLTNPTTSKIEFNFLYLQISRGFLTDNTKAVAAILPYMEVGIWMEHLVVMWLRSIPGNPNQIWWRCFMEAIPAMVKESESFAMINLSHHGYPFFLKSLEKS